MNILNKYLFFTFLSCFAGFNCFSQKVGVVLSGGGAGGLAHIGVLKALEENNIPIDYIVGSSVGSLIGAYYAAGYSPSEIEQIVKNGLFQKVTSGELPPKYSYFFKKRDDYASWLTFKLSLNTKLINNLPTNVINSVPIDYYLMETFCLPNTRSGNNFDSLFVPFRCVASDVENKELIVFAKGDLASSVRASMSYPFYLKPIQIDGKLLFDGGLYNNFPTDVMFNDFHPDFIVGSSVAEHALPPDDDNLYLQLRHLLMKQTNFDIAGKKGVLIEPWCNVGLFNFDESKRLIDSGYAAGLRAVAKIRRDVNVNMDVEQLNQRRNSFKATTYNLPIAFNGVEISGVSKKAKDYIRNSIYSKKEAFTLKKFKKQYFRLAGDEKIKSIYPVAVKEKDSDFFKLKLHVKREKSFFIDVGGNISNRPISEAFLGLQYNYIGKIGFSAYANGYYGKLTTSGHAKMRFDFPAKVPFYIEPSFTASRWDYYRSSALFYDFQKPAYLIQEDVFGELNVGLPLGNISKMVFTGGYADWHSDYYQTDQFTKLDTADRTFFNFAYSQVSYELNTLNRKQYATEGTRIFAKAKYISGAESYYPGNTSIDTLVSKNYPFYNWVILKINLDSYIKTIKRFKIGIFAEGVYSTQSFFRNYNSSILSAPAFNPTPESQTLFIDNYRAHQYVAGGLKAITTPFKNFDIRFEAYLFQPVSTIVKTSEQKAKYSSPFLYRNFIGLAALVYNSPVGPMSFGVNYYDKNENTFSVFVHFGYTIFNKKSMD